MPQARPSVLARRALQVHPDQPVCSTPDGAIRVYRNPWRAEVRNEDGELIATCEGAFSSDGIFHTRWDVVREVDVVVSSADEARAVEMLQQTMESRTPVVTEGDPSDSTITLVYKSPWRAVVEQISETPYGANAGVVAFTCEGQLVGENVEFIWSEGSDALAGAKRMRAEKLLREAMLRRDIPLSPLQAEVPARRRPSERLGVSTESTKGFNRIVIWTKPKIVEFARLDELGGAKMSYRGELYVTVPRESTVSHIGNKTLINFNRTMALDKTLKIAGGFKLFLSPCKKTLADVIPGEKVRYVGAAHTLYSCDGSTHLHRGGEALHRGGEAYFMCRMYDPISQSNKVWLTVNNCVGFVDEKDVEVFWPEPEKTQVLRVPDDEEI